MESPIEVCLCRHDQIRRTLEIPRFIGHIQTVDTASYPFILDFDPNIIHTCNRTRAISMMQLHVGCLIVSKGSGISRSCYDFGYWILAGRWVL